MTGKLTSTSMPAAFERALADVERTRWRPEIHVEKIPAPSRIAPYTFALSADVVVHSSDVGGGRLILLHDPAGNSAWEGVFRCVTYARAEIDAEMAADPLLPDVGWGWLTQALNDQGCTYLAPAGTVTAVCSKSFGGMAKEPISAEVEVRASWTPVVGSDGAGFADHLNAWSALLCLCAGLPPLPADIAVLPSRGRRR